MSDKKPMVLVFAGPNGSGKSTILQFFTKVGTYTNADDVVASTGISNEEAAVLVDKRRRESIRQLEDFTFETVLSSQYKMDLLREAKDSGYFIKCIFVLTSDVKINLARVETRVASGGHNVDKDKVISRYQKSLDNIPELLEICDIMHIYDNSTLQPIRIVRKHKNDLTLIPNRRWSLDNLLELIGADHP